MARYRESAAVCTHCQSHVWALRQNHFFATWRCSGCSRPVTIVGDAKVQRYDYDQARIVQTYPVGETSVGSAVPYLLMDAKFWIIFAVLFVLGMLYILSGMLL